MLLLKSVPIAMFVLTHSPKISLIPDPQEAVKIKNMANNVIERILRIEGLFTVQAYSMAEEDGRWRLLRYIISFHSDLALNPPKRSQADQGRIGTDPEVSVFHTFFRLLQTAREN